MEPGHDNFGLVSGYPDTSPWHSLNYFQPNFIFLHLPQTHVLSTLKIKDMYIHAVFLNTALYIRNCIQICWKMWDLPIESIFYYYTTDYCNNKHIMKVVKMFSSFTVSWKKTWPFSLGVYFVVFCKKRGKIKTSYIVLADQYIEICLFVCLFRHL